MTIWQKQELKGRSKNRDQLWRNLVKKTNIVNTHKIASWKVKFENESHSLRSSVPLPDTFMPSRQCSFTFQGSAESIRHAHTRVSNSATFIPCSPRISSSTEVCNHIGSLSWLWSMPYTGTTKHQLSCLSDCLVSIEIHKCAQTNDSFPIFIKIKW